MRVALFTAVLLGGALFFESIGLFVRDEAWLIAGMIAAVLLFCVPERGKPREVKGLIFNLVAVIAIYGIFLKFRPWLAVMVGGKLAAAMSVLLVVAFAAILWLLPLAKQNDARTGNTQ
jgi:hypothetical protein